MDTAGFIGDKYTQHYAVYVQLAMNETFWGESSHLSNHTIIKNDMYVAQKINGMADHIC